MKSFLPASLGFAALVGVSLAIPPALADNPIDLEAARANARAGGPISSYDQYLLQLYGCSSGTYSPYCAENQGYRGYRSGLKHKLRRARKW